MKNKITIILLIFLSLLVSHCLHREYAEEVDPELPRGNYYIRYFETCGMQVNCNNQLTKEKAERLDEYYMTFEKGELLIVLAYYYRDKELFRKLFYYYDELENLIKAEFTDSNNNILSYNLYEYDDKKILLRMLEYLEGDILYKDTRFIYKEFGKIKIIDSKDYSESEFVRRKYIVFNYNAQGELISQTDYDTYYLVFKPPIGELTKDFLTRYFLKNPRILEYELVSETEDYAGYTILHLKTNTKEIAQKLLVALNFVGEIRDIKETKFDKNIITFIR